MNKKKKAKEVKETKKEWFGFVAIDSANCFAFSNKVTSNCCCQSFKVLHAEDVLTVELVVRDIISEIGNLLESWMVTNFLTQVIRVLFLWSKSIFNCERITVPSLVCLLIINSQNRRYFIVQPVETKGGSVLNERVSWNIKIIWKLTIKFPGE